MATDVLVQNGTDADRPQPLTLRDSGGRIFALYGHSTLVMVYSDDNGATWSNEISLGASGSQSAMAIDSSDVIRVVYVNGSSKPTYVEFSDLTWGATEQIDATSVSSRSMDVAIDSVGDVHAVWVIPGNAEACVYNKRTAGVWGTKTTILDNDGCTKCFPKIVVDSQDRLMLVFLQSLVGAIVYSNRYQLGAWGGNLSVNTVENPALQAPTGITVDSNDNVYIVYQGQGSGVSTNHLRYRKYTASTGLWGSDTLITTTTTIPSSTPWGAPSLACDASDNLHLVWRGGGQNGTNISYVENIAGVWQSDSILTAATTFSNPSTRSTVWPVVGGVHTNVPTTGYSFNYCAPTGSQFRYYSSPANWPATQDKNYTRGAIASVAVSDANLSNVFTSTGYANVLTVDSVFEDQTATDQYAVMLFKNKGNSPTDAIHVSWTGKASVAPTSSTVYLQIYNRNSSTWETLDSNSVQSAAVSFTLTGTKVSSLSDYYDGSNWVSCRIYQLAA